MIQAANNHLNTAFINLKVFTGKTLTNSYAESVNAQLRGVGMNQQGSRVEQIKHLQEFTIQSLRKLDKPFVVTLNYFNYLARQHSPFSQMVLLTLLKT